MGDRVIRINGIDFSNIEHRAAVETIRKAGNRIVFTVERKVLEGPEDFSKNFPSGAESNTSLSTSQNNAEAATFVPSSVRLTEEERSRSAVEDTTAGGPAPHLVFPCPKPYTGLSNDRGAGGGGDKNEPSFDAMIPSEVKNPSAVVTVTIKQPDAISTKVPDIFPPAPTDLGTVTETITKSTLTETVFTRVTHNEPVMAPVLTEVQSRAECWVVSTTYS